MDNLHENVAYTPKTWDIVTDVSHSWADIDHFQLGSTPQYRIVYKDGCQDNDSDPDREAMYDRQVDYFLTERASPGKYLPIFEIGYPSLYMTIPRFVPMHSSILANMVA